MKDNVSKGAWRRFDIETFSALLALYEGSPRFTIELRWVAIGLRRHDSQMTIRGGPIGGGGSNSFHFAFEKNYKLANHWWSMNTILFLGWLQGKSEGSSSWQPGSINRAIAEKQGAREAIFFLNRFWKISQYEWFVLRIFHTDHEPPSLFKPNIIYIYIFMDILKWEHSPYFRLYL